MVDKNVYHLMDKVSGNILPIPLSNLLDDHLGLINSTSRKQPTWRLWDEPPEVNLSLVIVGPNVVFTTAVTIYKYSEFRSILRNLNFLLVQACVVADEAKLAIVFTYFFFLFLFFSPPSTFHPLRGISRA